jgi:methyl-accepting chemotaxis protein
MSGIQEIKSMKNYSRLAALGALVSGALLGGDVTLYLNNSRYLLADLLMFLTMLLCLGYLLKQATSAGIKKDEPLPSSGILQESSAFHVQLGNEISEQLSSAHTELGNTQAILNDAIAKLVSNFIAISDGVRDLSRHTNDFSKQIHDLAENVGGTLAMTESSVDGLSESNAAAIMESNQNAQSMVASLGSFNEIVAKNAVELNRISANVEQNVLVVISTLQFQDMSSQLIEHARMRMAALQEVANEMGKGRAGSPTHKEYMEQIAAYNRLLDKHVVSLDKQKANPVAQKDFGTGDIELF